MLKKIFAGGLIFIFSAGLASSEQKQSSTKQQVVQKKEASQTIGDKPALQGIGVVVGNPTGIALKYWVNEKVAYAGCISIGDSSSLYLHLDYLMHRYDKIETKDLTGRAPFYYGMGARLNLKGADTEFGIRFPLGITYLFKEIPIDIFAELTPILKLSPYIGLGASVGIGTRFYFQ